MIEEIILNELDCDWILNSCGEFYRGGMTYDGVSIEINDWRTCYEYSFVNNTQIINLILPKLKKFNVVSLPNTLTVVRYDKGQYFRNHIDSGIGHEYRYKSVSIQLSDRGNYNGGDLIIQIPDENGITTGIASNRNRGSMIMFDSSLLHEVDEIIYGTRYVLVFWLKKEDFNS